MRKMNANIMARFVQQFHLSIMILMTMKIPFIAGGNGFSDDISSLYEEDVDNDPSSI